MTAEMDPAEIDRLKDMLAATMIALQPLAERNVCRVATDFVGRMAACWAALDEIDCDELRDLHAQPYTPEEVERLVEELIELAALAAGRAVLIAHEFRPSPEPPP